MGRVRLAQFLHLQIAELDPVALAFQAQVALLHRAAVELAGYRPVDPQREHLAARSYFKRVPFPRRLDALFFDGLAQVEALLLAIFARCLAEEESILGIAELGLVPDAAVLRVADV